VNGFGKGEADETVMRNRFKAILERRAHASADDSAEAIRQLEQIIAWASGEEDEEEEDRDLVTYLRRIVRLLRTGKLSREEAEEIAATDRRIGGVVSMLNAGCDPQTLHSLLF
jgi:hypothetical protein